MLPATNKIMLVNLHYAEENVGMGRDVCRIEVMTDENCRLRFRIEAIFYKRKMYKQIDLKNQTVSFNRRQSKKTGGERGAVV